MDAAIKTRIRAMLEDTPGRKAFHRKVGGYAIYFHDATPEEAAALVGVTPAEAIHEAEQVEQRRVNSLVPYAEYLRSPEWDRRRKRKLAAAGYRCQLCNAGNTRLDVHHRTYERRGSERDADLIVLCADCHGLFHGKLP